MTEPPSAEAMKLASRHADGEVKKCADEIDALIAERVSAETERCATVALEQRCERTFARNTMQSYKAGERTPWDLACTTIAEKIRARAERPAPPAAVVDYTERARKVIALVENCAGDAAMLAGAVAAEFSAVASERAAAAIRLFGQRVWSDTEEVAYQAGVTDERTAHQAQVAELYEAARNHEKQAKEAEAALLVRLQDSDVRKAVEAAINEQRALEAGGCFNPGDDTEGECADGDCYCTKQIAREADAALTKIAEMLK